ncbi:hypothetical protein X756_14850 [Mesorhizobium sp. LSHC412B00]|nr:hypothetical protein X756_14850 [Mesorhizobium sp. LSHC412B00]
MPTKGRKPTAYRSIHTNAVARERLSRLDLSKDVYRSIR